MKSTIDPKVLAEMHARLSIPGTSSQSKTQLGQTLEIITMTKLCDLKETYLDMKGRGKLAMAEVTLRMWEAHSLEEVRLASNEEHLYSIYPNLPPNGTASLMALVKIHDMLVTKKARSSSPSKHPVTGQQYHTTQPVVPTDESTSGLVSV